MRIPGCSAEFANAVDTLQAGACYRGTPEQVHNYPKKYLFYARGKRNGKQKQNYCDSDSYVQSLGPNDAVKLRAFLYSAQVRVAVLVLSDSKARTHSHRAVIALTLNDSSRRVSPSSSRATATRSVTVTTVDGHMVRTIAQYSH